MRCPTCGVDGKLGRKFCAKCGGALPLACPTCSFANEPDDRFCGGCGTAINQPEAAASDAESDLRPVTILFADLSGYTKLSNTLEADETRDLLNAFFAAADSAVTAAGGRVDKHIGDCVMALFGAPIAHGDDSARAASAAIAIRDSTRGLAQKRGVALDSHSGIATGLVAAGDTGSSVHRSYTVIGQAVNLAARLCDSARPGEVVVAADIARSLAAQFAFEAEREIAVDGFAQPIKVANLTGRSMAGDGGSPNIVGRERELRLLEAALAAARDTGRGQVVVLRGDAGLGKSRLVEETVARARAAGFVVDIARVLSFGSGPDAEPMRAALAALTGFDAARDPVEALAVALRTGELPAHVQALGFDLAGFAVPDDLRSILGALSPEGRELGRAELIAGLARQASLERPLLFVVEDMHWAGKELIQALAHVARVIANAATVLLLTVRPEADPFDTAWRGSLGTTPLSMIDLVPLDLAEARRLVGNIAEGSAAIERIVARAGGSPLFLVQLSHFAFEAETELPGNIRSLIAARIDQLSPEARRILQCAAVLGLRFGRPELEFMRGEPSLKLDELVHRHLLRPLSGTIEFVHALVRDAVYDTLPKSRRKPLHERAALWFASRDTALWAHHLGLAGDPGAARAYLQAAAEARSAHRLGEAREHNGRGLAIASNDADRLDLLAQRGEILLDAGEGREAEPVWREAAAIAGEGRALSRAEIGVAQALRLLGRGGEAEQALQRAEAMARGDRDADLLSLLHFMRGNLLFPTGRYDECAREHGLALDHARRAGSAEAEVRALGGMGDSDYLRGRIASAETSFRACIELADRHGFGRIALANRPMYALCRLLCGDLNQAATILAATVKQAGEIVAKREEMIAQHGVCMCKLEQGDFAGALAAAERARELSVELGARHFEYEAMQFRAFALIGLGDGAAGLIESRRALAIARHAGMAFMGPVCLAAVAAMTSDESERTTMIEECSALLGAGCIAHNQFLSYPLLIKSAIAHRDWAGALRWSNALEKFAAPEPFFHATLISSAGRALARYGGGDEQAGDLARQIAADAEGRGFVTTARWIVDSLT